MMKIAFWGAANPETVRMIRATERVVPNFHVAGFLDSDPAKKGTSFHGYPVLGGIEAVSDLIAAGVKFVNLITGSTKHRYEVSKRMADAGCDFTNFIHPGVDLTMVSLGKGNYIQEGVVLQAAVSLGDNSSIHIGTMVGHETTIGNSVFVAHACSLSGSVNVGDGVTIGTNATILPRLSIGNWAVIGAGSVVIKDVPAYATVVGNPAKVIRDSDHSYADGRIFRG